VQYCIYLGRRYIRRRNKEIGKQEIKIKERRRRRRSFFGGLLALAGLF
jgi:hypothetical protein